MAVRSSRIWLVISVVTVHSTWGFHTLKQNKEELWSHNDRLNEKSFNNAFETDLCETVRCHKGEECVLQARMAVCKCRTWCPTMGTVVCASDGETYPTHCEMHRQACLSRIKLRVASLGPCASETSSRPTTVVSKSSDEVETHQSVRFISMPNTGTLELGEIIKNSGVPMAQILAPKIISFEKTLQKHDNEIKKLMVKTVDEKLSSQKGAIEDATTESYTSTFSDEPETTESNCDDVDYGFMQNNLLLYFHAKYAETGKGETEHNKKFLLDLIFKNLDRNSDGKLTKQELVAVQSASAQFKNLLPIGCDLSGLVTFADMDKDGTVSKEEFLRSYGFPIGVLSKEDQTKSHTVPFSEQYQVMCNIQVPHGQRVIWLRYGRQLTNIAPNNFEFSKSGASIYLTPASLVHNGNFTCEYRTQHFPTVSQTHLIAVLKQPKVKISPTFLLLKIGESGRLYCDFEGLQPMEPGKISWEKNGRALSHNSTILEFKNAQLEETGSYTCMLSTRAGAAHAAASVVVRADYQQPERSLRSDQYQKEVFAVLYEGGVRSYNADTCKLERVIPSSYMAPELNRPSLCENYRCEWSDVVRAGNLIYAALSKEKAIAVLDLSIGAVKQIMPLDFDPKRLFYIPWKDTVWVETWHDSTGVGRTVLVIHSASDNARHGLTHALPLVKSFDTVSNIFLPSQPEIFSNPVLYGYVTHYGDERLHKLDLHKLSVVSTHDLSAYKCHPKDVAYLTNAGLVALYCIDYRTGEPNGQLILDYLTDTVLEHRTDLYGVPVVTPDSGSLISVDQKTGRIFLQKITMKGLTLERTVDELYPIDDWTVFPSEGATFGYNIYAVSSKVNYIIKIVLDTGKVENLANLSEDISQENSIGNSIVHQKQITVKSRINGRFMAVTMSHNNATIFDISNMGKVHCQVEKLPNIGSIVWL